MHPTLKRSRHNRTPKNASPWCTLSVLHSDQRSTGGQSLAQCTHMQFTQVFSAPGSAQFFKQPLRMQACLCALLSRRLVQHGRARRLRKAPPRQGCVQAPPSGVVHALPHHKQLKSHPCAGNASVVVFPAHTGLPGLHCEQGTVLPRGRHLPHGMALPQHTAQFTSSCSQPCCGAYWLGRQEDDD